MLGLGLGVGAAAARRAGLIIASGLPAWVPANSLAFYDFQNDRAYSNGILLSSSTAGLTTSRGSIGYDLLATTQFAANVARRTAAGLLVEPAATNLAPFSNQPTSWPVPAATTAPTGLVGPDGTSQAYQVVVSSTNRFYGPRPQYTSGATGTASFFVRGSASGPASKTRISSTNTSAFNTGTTSPDFTLTSAWQRIAYTGVFQTGSTQADVGIGSRTAANVDGGAAYYGNIDLCFAQVELTSFATSYIPTANGSATRAADTITLTLPAGTVKVDLAYDDGTTSTVTASAGTFTIPANPANANLKSLRAA